MPVVHITPFLSAERSHHNHPAYRLQTLLVIGFGLVGVNRQLRKRGEVPCSIEEAVTSLMEVRELDVLLESEEPESGSFAEYVAKRGGEPVAVLLIDKARREISQARVKCGDGWVIYGLIPRRSRDRVPYLEYSWMYIDGAGRQRTLELVPDEAAKLTNALNAVVEKILGR